MIASPPAAPGMPAEEIILRVVQGVMDRDNHAVALKATRAILSLIRPAFEAKDAEIARIANNRDMWKGQSERQAKTLFELRMQMLADEGQSRER